jgi:transposase
MSAVDRHTLLAHVEEQGLSQRAACRLTGVSRSVSRYKLQRPDQDAQALESMHKGPKTIHATAIGGLRS